MVAPYAIDPAWPVVRDTRGDQILEEGLDACEQCWARLAQYSVDRGGIETLVCGYCR